MKHIDPLNVNKHKTSMNIGAIGGFLAGALMIASLQYDFQTVLMDYALLASVIGGVGLLTYIYEWLEKK